MGTVRAWIIFLLWALAGAAGASAEPLDRVTAVRFVSADDHTRVIIESSNELKYDIFSLSAGSQRIVIDLPRIRWSIDGLTAESGSGKGSGLVAGYRYAQNTASTSRLVLDLAAPALVTRDYVITPRSEGVNSRLVIDLDSTSDTAFVRAAEADRGGHKTEARKVVRKPLVVIDPGHGGKDPGASAPDGTQEKDITLAIALALRDELVATGRYDVALTRSTDTFIELEDRVTKARDLGADLFIALHADAGKDRDTRGASIYTLSPEGEKRAENLRHKNDWVLAVETDQTRPQEVNQILADLVTRETKNQSARFAQTLAPALADAGWPVLENTLRKRGFYVLLSPDVPAILLEMGFITNAGDEAMMTSQTRRKKLVRGIREAIDSFFDTETRVLAQR
ncbi:MAG: AMIN domain-containing protein [Alphaproteobacteria bacterium]|nr:AMIN domain-containing protein [Alphaproteobacteria bacterium]